MCVNYRETSKGFLPENGQGPVEHSLQGECGGAGLVQAGCEDVKGQLKRSLQLFEGLLLKLWSQILLRSNTWRTKDTDHRLWLRSLRLDIRRN